MINRPLYKCVHLAIDFDRVFNANNNLFIDKIFMYVTLKCGTFKL